MSTERSHVPDGIDPDESPFELPAIEGLPFDRNSVEATAIHEVLSGLDGEGSDASPWRAQAIEGIPFGKDSDEARAIARVLEQAEKEQDASASQRD